MAVRTISELAEILDSSLAWRRIELSALKSEVERSAAAGATSPLARAMARSALAMLYAHWEGFGRDALGGYVEFISRRRLKFEELNDGLLMTTFASMQRRISSGDESAAKLLLEAIRRPATSRAPIPRSSMVNTRSNLKFSVLCEILDSVGLEKLDFEMKAQLIDRSLCDARNEIAHGREKFPTPREFSDLHQQILALMETLRDAILAGARTGSYRTPHDSGSEA